MNNTAKHRSLPFLFELVLFAIILIGIFFQFYGRNWNDGTDLHPDEYDFTNTISLLSFPKNPEEWFNTRSSPISPYARYDTDGNITGFGPDLGMRWGQWPIFIIRGIAELTDTASYIPLRLTGRTISAILNTLCLLIIYSIGRKLYGHTTGLLAAALSSLAVLQIQSSHFMTVDSFAVFFSALAMLAATQISSIPFFKCSMNNKSRQNLLVATRINRLVPWYSLFFAIAYGMALASKINLIPLFGLLLAYLVSASRPELSKSSMIKALIPALALTVFVLLAALLTFRVTQPMSFRVPVGDTSFFSFQLNPEWLANLQTALTESGGATTAPPAEQWTDRPAIIFPLMNMVFWGMGLPMGIAAWAGFILACWQVIKLPYSWRQHSLPLVWAGGFFLFMATRWVKSIRYFLPVYPFFALLAAFFLVWVANERLDKKQPSALKTFLHYLPAIAVLLGSLAYASAFVHAVYSRENSRVTATRWIYQNLSAPVQLEAQGPTASFKLPFALAHGTSISTNLELNTSSSEQGTLTGLSFAHLHGQPGQVLNWKLLADGTVVAQNALVLAETADPAGNPYTIPFPPVKIMPGQKLTLHLSLESGPPLTINRNTILVEEWDEGLPLSYDGFDPYGMFYNGIVLPNRWGDNSEELDRYLEALDSADMITISSQRSI